MGAVAATDSSKRPGSAQLRWALCVLDGAHGDDDDDASGCSGSDGNRERLRGSETGGLGSVQACSSARDTVPVR